MPCLTFRGAAAAARGLLTAILLVGLPATPHAAPAAAAPAPNAPTPNVPAPNVPAATAGQVWLASWPIDLNTPTGHLLELMALVALLSSLAALRLARRGGYRPGETTDTRASALAPQIEHLTEILPKLLAEALAVATPGAQPALAALAALVERLEQGVERVDGANSALNGGITALARAASHYAALQIEGAKLAMMCERLVRELPAIANEAVAGIDRRTHAMLETIEQQGNTLAARIDASLEGAAARLQHGGTALATNAAAPLVDASAVETLLRSCTQMASDLPVLANTVVSAIETRSVAAMDAVDSKATTVLAQIGACLDDTAGRVLQEVASLEDAAARLQQGGTALAANAAAQLAAASDAETLLRSCSKMAADLPVLANTVVSAIETRSVAAMDAVDSKASTVLAHIGGRLEDTAGTLLEGVASLSSSIAAQADAAAGADSLRQNCAQLLEELPGMADAVVSSIEARSRSMADRMDGRAKAIVAQIGSALEDAVARLQNEAAAATPMSATPLQSAAGGEASLSNGSDLARGLQMLANEAISRIETRSLTVLDDIGSQANTVAATIGSALDDAASRLHGGVSALASTTAAQAESVADVKILLQSCAKLAQDLPLMATDAIHGIDSASQAAARQNAALAEAHASLVGSLETFVARADALVTELPNITGDLDAASSGAETLLRSCTQMASDLPILANTVVSAIETRSVAALDAVDAKASAVLAHIGGRLEDTAGTLLEGVASLSSSIAAQADAAAGTDSLRQSCAQLVEELPGMADAVVSSIEARSRSMADRMDGQAKALVAQIGSALEDAVARLQNEAAAAMPMSATPLQSAAGGDASLSNGSELARGLQMQANEAISRIETRSLTVLDDIGSQANTVAATIGSALASTTAAQAETVADVKTLLQSCAQLAHDLPLAANDAIHGIDSASQAAARQNAALAEAHASLVGSLEAFLARAEALATELPSITGDLDAAAIALRHAAHDGGAHIIEAGASANRAAALALEAAAALPEAVSTLNEAAARIGTDLAITLSGLPASGDRVAALGGGLNPAALSALEAMPATVAQISVASAALTDRAAALEQMSSRMQAISADQTAAMSALIAAPAEAITGLCARADHSLTTLEHAAAQLRADSAELAAREALAFQAPVALAPADAAHPGLQECATMTTEAAIRLTIQTERMAELLAAGEDAACRFEMATEAVAKAAPAAAAMPDLSQSALANLEASIAEVTGAAGRLAAQAELHEQASARVAAAALALADAASAATAAPDALQPGIQTALHAVQNGAVALHGEAHALAHAAATGRMEALPPEVAAGAPGLLAAIDLSIRQLQGAATSLALASDAACKAA